MHPYLHTPVSRALCLFTFFSFSTTANGHGVSIKSEADLKAHIWSWRTKENMQRKKRGYANRDNQSGITLDRKKKFIYCKRLFLITF